MRSWHFCLCPSSFFNYKTFFVCATDCKKCVRGKIVVSPASHISSFYVCIMRKTPTLYAQQSQLMDYVTKFEFNEFRDEVNHRFDSVDKKFTAVDVRFSDLDKSIKRISEEMRTHVGVVVQEFRIYRETKIGRAHV